MRRLHALVLLAFAWELGAGIVALAVADVAMLGWLTVLLGPPRVYTTYAPPPSLSMPLWIWIPATRAFVGVPWFMAAAVPIGWLALLALRGPGRLARLVLTTSQRASPRARVSLGDRHSTGYRRPSPREPRFCYSPPPPSPAGPR